MQGHGATDEKAGHHLDVDAADMKQRQNIQNVVGRREIMGMKARYSVPENSLLGEHRAFRPSRGTRGVDDEERIVQLGLSLD